MTEPLDVGNPEHVAREKRRAKSRDQQLKTDIMDVLSTPAGRRVVWHILSHCEPMAINQRLDNSVWLLEGRREVGLWLISELTRADSRAYIRLMDQAGRDAFAATSGE